MLEQEKKHRLEIEYMKKTHMDLKNTQDKHLEYLRKTYNELSIQKENDLNKKEQQLVISHQKEIKEKEKLIQVIQKESSAV